MPQTLHISMPDNLHSELSKLADADFKKLGEYCKDILIKHVKAEIEKSKPKTNPEAEEKARHKLAARLEKERRKYDGRSIDEWVEFFSGPYENLGPEYAGTAEHNLPIWLQRKSENYGIPLEELQAKYKVQKPKASNAPKPTKPVVVDPYEGDDAHDEYDHIIKALEAEDAARMNVGSK